jgi:hypothetical protein
MPLRYIYLWLGVMFCLAAPCSLPSGPADRDLRAFEDGGTITFRPRDDSRNSEPSAKLRRFLWSHWISRRRGVIRQLGYGIEGTSSQTSFFIEPDGQGAWRIVAERKYQEMRRPDDVEEKTSSYEAYSVRRVKPGREEPESRPTIPKHARIPARSYRLVLSNKEGKVLAEL